MIFGDTLIITKNGIEVSSNTLETIGIFENSEVHLLPFRTYEYRTHEQGVHFPLDLLITPINPKNWPFVIRFVLRLYNRPGALEQAFSLFNKLGINILFSECTRSGHHHSVLNVLGVIKRLEGRTMRKFFEELQDLSIVKHENKDNNPWWFYAFENFCGEDSGNVDRLDAIKKKFNALLRKSPEKDDDKKSKEANNEKSAEVVIQKTENDNFKFSDLVEAKEDYFSKKRKNFNEDNFDEHLGELIGEFLSYYYLRPKKNELSLSEILEQEVERVRPIIRQFEKEYREQKLLNKKLYKKVENEIVPMKCLLRAIINYKQLLCNKFEILILKDTLIRDEINLKTKKYIFKLDQFKDYIKRDRYIYNLPYYFDQAKYRRFSEEIFLDDFNIDFELLFEKLFRSKQYLKKIETLEMLHKIEAPPKEIENTKKRVGELEDKLTDFYLKFFRKSFDKYKCKINKEDGRSVDSNGAFEDFKSELKDTLKNKFNVSKDKVDPLVDQIWDELENKDIGKEIFGTLVKEIGYNDLIKKGLEYRYYNDKNKLNWQSLIKILLSTIEDLPFGRKEGITSGQSRLDLDPIIITPVEFLSHAYYHLAYQMNFTSFAGKSRIPFPKENKPGYPKAFLNDVLPENQLSTFAVASRNTEDLTLRLCPLSVRKIHEFSRVELKSYIRNCFNECEKNGTHQYGQEDMYEFRYFPSKDESDEEKVYRACDSTTMGLAYTLTSALNPNSEEKTVNIWRAFNKTFYSNPMGESGSINYLIQEIPGGKKILSEKKGKKLEERLGVMLDKIRSSDHTDSGKISLKRLTGGNIFISLPFRHPMSKKWLEYVRNEGLKMGFSRIQTVETFINPVTPSVAEGITESDAMIQILSLPLGKKGSKQKSRPVAINGLTWLHSEYLTAVTNKISIVRLIDEATVDPNDLLIGRDHATFSFNAGVPITFEKVVKKAFKALRDDLSDKLGLS